MQPAVAAIGDFMDPNSPITCSIGAGEGQLSWHTAGAPRAHPQHHRAIVYYQVLSPAGDVGSLAALPPCQKAHQLKPCMEYVRGQGVCSGCVLH